jgi:His-Xaa-Ser system protein HxsD
MKSITKYIEENKLLLKIDSKIYEQQAILNASYKFTDKCFINIELVGQYFEVYFQSQNSNVDLELIALNFGNELIDQQIRLDSGKEFKVIREELVKKAFASISK